MDWLLRLVYGPVVDEDLDISEDTDYYREAISDMVIDGGDAMMVVTRPAPFERASFKHDLDPNDPLAEVDEYLSSHSSTPGSVEDFSEATHRRRKLTPYEFLILQGKFPAYSEELDAIDVNLDTGEQKEIDLTESYTVEIIGRRLPGNRK